MAETCIVCLGDLRASFEEQSHTEPPTSPRQANESCLGEEDETIAHLLPCGHNLHDSCLKPWVERANSCPICRRNFNMVEQKAFIDGPTLSEYAVQDKKQQQTELDPGFILEEEDVYELEEPCLLCGQHNDEYETMYCDGCDRAVHGFCAGTDDIPEVWYCQECLHALDNNGVVTSGQRRGRNRPVRGQQGRRARQPRRRDEWSLVWASVWDRLNFDLDFPFAEASVTERTAARRRDVNAWEQRLRVAGRQGAGNRFRNATSNLVEPPPARETQEEMSAWNAFDKARELDDAEIRPQNRRKRKSETNSPASPRNEETTQERRLKRPRTRRNLTALEPINNGESSSRAAAAQRPVDTPSFLTSLLHEVERQPVSVDHSSPDGTDGQISPPMSSPVMSPLPSNYATPRANSVTPPPPLNLPRPSSPMPLTSIVRPAITSPNATLRYSPFSPAQVSSNNGTPRRRDRQSSKQKEPTKEYSPQSPSHHLSYSTKAELQRMVKNALGSRYRNNEITKDQYTDINRDISHLLYQSVEDAGGLADQAARDTLQKLANDEVEKAITTLRAQA